MEQLNIVELIENNPITKLSNTYNSKFLNKIKNCFTEFEQQLFVSSFYCYLNYDKNIDFVIDLDNVWKWLGFKQKIDAKRLLEKYFKYDIDYTDSKDNSEVCIETQLHKEISIVNTHNSINLALGKSKASSPNEKWGGQNIKKLFQSP